MFYEIKAIRVLIIALSCLFYYSVNAQKGKDGADSYSSGTSILNRYAILASSVSTGASVITVTNINDLDGSTGFANSVNTFGVDALSHGDLVLLIQVQGANMSILDNSAYGTVTSLSNTGNYELAQVFLVSGNQINLCRGTKNAYNQGGRYRTQVIRVPRLSTLAVGATATVAGRKWNGATGGIVAIETNSDITLNGNISADTIGFRGGTDEINGTIMANPNSAVNFYRRVATDSSAEKGEGIVGDSAGYAGLNGGNGRGAAANGGGGGNGHNGGGGGGSNAGRNFSLTPYNGTGIKDTAGNWDNAWNLEATGFALDSSVGGGRGGYTYGSFNLDALTVGPNLSVWGGDGRHNVGGLGGHPLDYSSGNALFMGGGGGAGDGNNSRWGNGGNGGGIIFILSNGNIGGAGSIRANGMNGYTTRNVAFGNDAGGGAGAGGAIRILSEGTITGISISANGGKGGLQTINNLESEGPGGGGGGGYVETTGTNVTRAVNGGDNGITTSTAVTEFNANGATKGSPGTISSVVFADVAALCNPLPVVLLDFSALKNSTSVSLQWNTAAEINLSNFYVEHSNDSRKWSTLLSVPARNSPGTITYGTDDKNPSTGKNYYRLKMIDKGGELFAYSKIIKVDFNTTEALRVYPNPVTGSTLNVESKNVIQYLQLTNASGQVVVNKKGAANSMVITLPALAPGIYEIKIISGKETITRKLSIGF